MLLPLALAQETDFPAATAVPAAVTLMAATSAAE